MESIPLNRRDRLVLSVNSCKGLSASAKQIGIHLAYLLQDDYLTHVEIWRMEQKLELAKGTFSAAFRQLEAYGFYRRELRYLRDDRRDILQRETWLAYGQGSIDPEKLDIVTAKKAATTKRKRICHGVSVDDEGHEYEPKVVT